MRMTPCKPPARKFNLFSPKVVIWCARRQPYFIMTPEQLETAQQIIQIVNDSGILDKITQTQGVSKDLIYLGILFASGVSFFLGKLMSFHKDMKGYREMTLKIMEEISKLISEMHETIKLQIKMVEEVMKRT